MSTCKVCNLPIHLDSEGVWRDEYNSDDQHFPKADPRNNADDAYAAFMSMGQDEWQGLLLSLLGGGVLQPAEQIGFERALIGPDSRDARDR